MLDLDLIEQLKSLFAPLDRDLVLSLKESSHPDQSELASMLEAAASASERIRVENAGVGHALPSFTLLTSGKKTGITFTGIPGGHEFSSFVLAILNAGGIGKFPDEGIQARIRSLNGPIRLKTYISLSCENCPDVVQTLNQMCLIHPDFEHEVIDGGLTPEEIDQLGIQGVPSIVSNGKLIHSGRIQLLDLIAKLESHFGSAPSEEGSQKIEKDLGIYDVVILGGGPAGASAAIYSARKGLSTAIIAERMGGQVQETKGIENLISTPYTEGPELASRMGEHLSRYPVKVLENRRVKSVSKSAEKVIELESGERIRTSTVIVTTGAKWRELGIPGEKEYLGRGVAFCPHCDGPFYKGKKVGVVGGGNSGVEAAIDLAGIASEVVLFEYADRLKADQILIDKLNSLPNTSVILSARTKEVLGNQSRVEALLYEDRTTSEDKRIGLDGIFVQIGLLPNSGFLKGTVDLSPQGEILIDAKGRTSEPGIYAAGDVTNIPFKQIIIAMGEGAKTALTAFEDRTKLLPKVVPEPIIPISSSP